MRNRSKTLMLACIAAILIAPSLVLADYISPGDVKVKTEKFTPESADFEKGTYTYDVRWQGIPVAQAKVVVGDGAAVESSTETKKTKKLSQDEQPKVLKVAASAKTGSFLDFFYKLRFKSESSFDADSLQPRSFTSYQKENSKVKERRVSFGENGMITTVAMKNGKTNAPFSFHSDNLTLDPISAAFIARRLPVKVGTKKSFDVFNGKHRYLITFRVEAREDIEVKDKKYDAYRVVPEVIKLTDTEGEDRLKYAAIWISADNAREVLKLESKVLVGSVSANLVEFVPAGQSAPQKGLQVAQAR